MRELVKDQRREGRGARIEHGAEQRIAQDAERRVGAHAAHHDIMAAAGLARGERPRRRFLEVTAIGDAAGDRKTPAPQLQRQRGRHDHVPDHVGPAHINIVAITAVVRQCKLGAGEVDRGCGAGDARAQRRGGTCVPEQRLDRLALAQQSGLAAGGLQQIGRAARRDCQ